MVKEPEEFELVQESPVSHADTRSIELVRLSDAGATDDSRFLADDSLDHDTSPSLVPHSQSMNPASSIAESSQSIIPPSEEPKHKKYIWFKFVRKRVMVAYIDLLGESGTLILIALNMSDFMVRIIIAEFYKILHVTGR